MMIHQMPRALTKEGRDENRRDTKNSIVSLARSGRMNQRHTDAAHKAGLYFDRSTSERSLVVKHGVDWSFANLARREVPEGVKEALKELLEEEERHVLPRGQGLPDSQVPLDHLLIV